MWQVTTSMRILHLFYCQQCILVFMSHLLVLVLVLLQLVLTAPLLFSAAERCTCRVVLQCGADALVVDKLRLYIYNRYLLSHTSC